MTGEPEGSLYIALECGPKISFQGALKVAQKGEVKDIDVVIDSLLDSAIEGAREDAPKDALNNL